MPVSVRIGIHTGLAIVGNIGAPGRINYTLVGDTVNVAARLEQLCKEMPAESSTVVLVSGATAALAHDRSDLKPRGAHPVRGRDNDIEPHGLKSQRLNYLSLPQIVVNGLAGRHANHSGRQVDAGKPCRAVAEGFPRQPRTAAQVEHPLAAGQRWPDPVHGIA